jgi:hypothetical protein
MAVAGGASRVQNDDLPELDATRRLLQLETGLGSNPRNSWVFGGLVRTWTHFGAGTDLVLAQRTASGGFARGNWGVALDVGGYQRWWGPDSTGVTGTLSLGAPWGLTLAAAAAVGSGAQTTLGLTLGIDWARATAHRESGLNWWPNVVLPSSRQP